MSTIYVPSESRESIDNNNNNYLSRRARDFIFKYLVSVSTEGGVYAFSI